MWGKWGSVSKKGSGNTETQRREAVMTCYLNTGAYVVATHFLMSFIVRKHSDETTTLKLSRQLLIILAEIALVCLHYL